MLLHIEGERAKRRQGQRNDLVPISAPSEDSGKAREKVAEALGSGKNKVTQASAVVKAIDDLEASGDKRHAAQLRTTLVDTTNFPQNSATSLFNTPRAWTRQSAPAEARAPCLHCNYMEWLTFLIIAARG